LEAGVEVSDEALMSKVGGITHPPLSAAVSTSVL
jgi:hypothetical protein